MEFAVLEPSAAAVVQSIIAIAHNLGLTAVAEGVETQEQLSFLMECQCDEFQGYLFSHPLPAEEFIKLIDQKEERKRRTGIFGFAGQSQNNR